MDKMKYETNIQLFNSYFDFNDRIKPKSVLSIFQDIASIHGEEIGVGYEEMQSKDLCWVISRIKFDVLKMPQINDDVLAVTWPHKKGIADFDRDFVIKDKSDEQLIIGTSKWCVIDMASRNLVRSDNVNYKGECIPDTLYPQKFSKMLLPDCEFKFQFDYKVLFSDLDHNKHMNNTNYANLVVSAVQNKNFTHFEINFLHECLFGDTISVFSTKSDGTEWVIGKVQDKTVFVAFVK